MRILAWIFLCGASCAAAQTSSIPAPDNWRRESFQFPLAFAPSIPYEGAEHVRFAPAWSEFASDQGFTYVFLWDIKRVPIEAAHLERGLAVYFDGLMENVAHARKVAELPVSTAVVLHPLAAPAGWKEAYAGTIHTWNAFSRGEDLALAIEIAHRPCAEARMQVFFAVSKAKRTAAPWDELRRVRSDTPCSN
jgi:hypothetical protein